MGNSKAQVLEEAIEDPQADYVVAKGKTTTGVKVAVQVTSDGKLVCSL